MWSFLCTLQVEMIGATHSDSDPPCRVGANRTKAKETNKHLFLNCNMSEPNRWDSLQADEWLGLLVLLCACSASGNDQHILFTDSRSQVQGWGKQHKDKGSKLTLCLASNQSNHSGKLLRKWSERFGSCLGFLCACSAGGNS